MKNMQDAENSNLFNLLYKAFSRTHLTDERCNEEKDESRSKVGILFSGGIDSVVLTALADR